MRGVVMHKAGDVRAEALKSLVKNHKKGDPPPSLPLVLEGGGKSVTLVVPMLCTHTVTEPTESFAPGDQFCYSISLTEPFGTAQIGEEVLRIESDGSLTVVQSRDNEIMDVTPAAQVAGFCTRATGLIQAWSTGNFIMREYRGVELIAEGHFAMTG